VARRRGDARHYDEKKRNAVIDTIRKSFPLNVMYWVVNNEGTYEVMDGQQRTISFCQYINGDFSIPVDGHPMAFHNLPKTLQDQILRLQAHGLLLLRYGQGAVGLVPDHQHCRGTPHRPGTTQRRLHRTVAQPRQNELLQNELSRLSARQQVREGHPIRQEYLETAISWLSDGRIEDYMAAHQHDPNANELWSYFQAVISWVELTFTTYRKEMKGVDWGDLYNQFKDGLYDTAKLEDEIKALMVDDDVTSKMGIYPTLSPATRNTWRSVRSRKPSGARHTNDRAESALGAASISRSMRWRQTTPPHGRRAARRTQPTARCCASRTTGARAQSNGQAPW
jgi:hypothetical protein